MVSRLHLGVGGKSESLQCKNRGAGTKRGWPFPLRSREKAGSSRGPTHTYIWLLIASPGNGTHSSVLAWKIPWTEEPGGLQSHGVAKSWTRLSDFPFTFHFHALQKEMAHSSVLAWRIPGTGEPGGLPSMGSHRVGHDWRDLAAAAAALLLHRVGISFGFLF